MNLADAERLFHQALELPSAPERSAFLKGACGDNEALRRQVEGLLAAHEKSAPFLPTEPGDRTVMETPSEGPGTVIGRYKLLQQIGEGGMGVVYMAEQTQPVVRKVAFKIIKLGMDTRQVVARFEAERQALALMDHPNIAKVLDAGATETGRPYFVMELVRGIPITEYCDKNHLSARQRLELFIPVCQAIQHAHQKGIIHRDIKPSNILVTLVDGQPLPMVIDFGIAKALHQRLTEKTLYTNFAQMIGTPAYMSPEQAEMSKLDVDTRTDIYSLGVLLYELLTGTTPFSSKELLEAGYGAMQRIIAEQEPLRPSTRLNTMQQAQRTSVAQNRRMEPSALTRLFQGDLDWIVMKCLEKERGRRYETASGLAADLQRHLAYEPVVARPPTARYRLQKAIRRNRIAFTAGAATVAALLIGVGASTWQAVVASRAKSDAIRANDLEHKQRLAAQAERDRAETAQREAQRARDAERAIRQEAEDHLYAANMNLVQQAWEQDNMGRLHQLLQETATYPGRAFEWYYWQRQMHRELLTLRGHVSPICSVVFSPDGQKLVTGSDDGTAKVWETTSGKELTTLKTHSLPLRWVASSPDDVRSEAFTPDHVHWVAFAPDGKRIATGGGPAARVWDVASGRLLLTLQEQNSDVISVAFSPDGQRIATGSYDGTVNVWDATSAQPLLKLQGHRGPVSTVAFSANGQRLFTSSPRSGTAKLWDATSGQEVLNLELPQNRCAACSPDGQRILTGNLWGALQLWDAVSGKELLTAASHGGPIRAVAFAPDGKRIVTCGVDMVAKVWEVASGRQLCSLKGHRNVIGSVAFSPDSQFVATGSADLTAKVWKVDHGVDALTFFGGWCAAFSPDGHKIITGSQEGTARVWETASGKELLALQGHANWVLSAAFSSDAQWIVTGSNDGTAKVWDAGNGKEQHTLTGHTGMVHSVTFSPDGQRIVTGGESDKTAKVWDARNGTLLLTLDVGSAVSSVAYSPDGERIVIGSDLPGKVWDAATGKPLLTLKGQSQAVAFSPDAHRIIVGDIDGTVKIWDAVNPGHDPLLSFKAHSSLIWSVAYSPDGQRIVTGGWDHTAKVWNATTGKELLTLKGHTNAVFSAAFSPNGQRIVTGGWDHTARVWEAATVQQVVTWQQEEEEARQRLAVWQRSREAAAQPEQGTMTHR